MEEITLAEAYRRRESIAEDGQSIYCKGSDTGVVNRIVFHGRQPGGVWYNIWLATPGDVSQVAMHADARVYIAAAQADQLRINPTDGRDLPLSA